MAVGAGLIAPTAHHQSSARQCGAAASFRQFSHRTWAPSKWRRGSPSPKVLAAKREQLEQAKGCGYRGKLRATWRQDKRQFYKRRSTMLFRERVTPFRGSDGKWYATPYIIPLCESGADPHIGYAGLYGLISPTWAAYGGYAFASTAGAASKHEQDIVAAKLWAAAGESAWAPFESGCAYR